MGIKSKTKHLEKNKYFSWVCFAPIISNPSCNSNELILMKKSQLQYLMTLNKVTASFRGI